MPQPTQRQLHVDRPLTDVSEAIMQDTSRFLARTFFPVIPVKHRSNQYASYPRQQWNRTDAAERAPGTESAGTGYEVIYKSYFCRKIALHTMVDDDTRDNADDQFQLDADATELVMRQILMRQEKDWNANYFGPGIWGTDITPGILWDAVGSTPIQDVDTGLLAVDSTTGLTPNTIGIGKRVWHVLKHHPEFLERIKYTQTGIVTTELLAAVWGVARVMVAGAVEDRANEGGTPDTDYIHGKHLLAVYSAPRPGLKVASAGYTFAWKGLANGLAGDAGTVVKKFRIEEKEADRIEGTAAYDQHQVAADLGVFFEDVIS